MNGRRTASTITRDAYSIPETMSAVIATGKGLDSIRVAQVPVPEPNENQILCRVDACTVCPSILKLLDQGSEHAFLGGWDMARYPVVLGDEGAVTAVKVGKNLARKYRRGERYAIQPAVDHTPINHRERYANPEQMEKVAVGYTLGGTFGQYLLILEEVIESNCVVKLPSPDLGHYEVSLSEPLSCVVSSQDHHVHLVIDPKTGERVPRKGLLRGGVVVIFGVGVMGRLHIELTLTYMPRVIVVFNRSPERFEWIHRFVTPRAEARGIKICCEQTDIRKLRARLLEHTGRAYADDVIDTTASPTVQQAALEQIVGRKSVFNAFGGLNLGENIITLDMRKLHYEESIITGSSGGTPHDTKRAISLIHNGVFDLGTQVKYVGGLRHAAEFLGKIRSHQIGGKAVIYPNADIDDVLTLSDPWTRQKERELLTPYSDDCSARRTHGE